MTAAFSRQLGKESGVQLNPVKDRSEMAATSVSDQVFAIAGRFTRGRIDRAFKVNEGNVRKLLGNGESMRKTPLNEAIVHVIEAVSGGGAYEAVVSRLTTSEAKIKWAVCIAAPNETDPEKAPAIVYSVRETPPVAPFLFAIKHYGCHNDGIKLAVHAESEKKGGVEQTVSKAVIRVLDKDDVVLHEFSGSFKEGETDDFGQSTWFPDVVANLTEELELLCAEDAEFQPDSLAYGDDSSGNPKWVKSDVLVCFDEGGHAYTTVDYERARKQLQYTSHNYSYISSGGTRAPALLSQMAILSFQTSRQLRFDVPGEMTPEQAIAFMEQINMGGQKEAHLLHAFWAPMKSIDPTSINAKNYFGMATLNIAMACGRNARLDANGLPPKNYPIAGSDWPIPRQGLTQTYFPSPQELSDLAKAKINPVIFEEYDSGSRPVFRDSLTCAPVDNSLKALIAVSDMSAHIDDAITRFCKSALQKPMATAIKKIDDYLRKLFEDAETAKWIKPSQDPNMKGAAALYVVKPSTARPYDTVVVEYALCYDGTNRATHATQTITR